VPEWMGSWFEVYPYWEPIAAQVLAAIFVVGSYQLAERMKRRQPGAHRAVSQPGAAPAA
jgi:high-affinity iron transporter